MREIKAGKITETIAHLCQQANYELGDDVLAALERAEQTEKSPLGRAVLRELLENAQIAREGVFPLCQDCGTAVVFLDVGQDVHIVGGELQQAVNEGVRQAYAQSYLRKSMVKQPFTERVNTGDNTPAVVHTEIVPGDRLRIAVMAKGGGAENMSRLAMLKPAQGREGIIETVVNAVDEAGGMPCPPLIIGLGIGGTAEMAMLQAKRSLLRPVGQPSPDPELAGLERDILERVNDLGIGPMGLGGRTTALAVHALAMPAHIASMPLAINLQCHSARHREAVL
ncbi:MAG TPA: fumarate hydratase [Dehalococcoidia bacterium]|nr:fumarate hydratase [Dehalococcoidia bacterium]